jgi:hypothetical protein
MPQIVGQTSTFIHVQIVLSYRTSIAPKVSPELVDQLSAIVTDAVLTIRPPDGAADLLMIEQLTMLTKLANTHNLSEGWSSITGSAIPR